MTKTEPAFFITALLTFSHINKTFAKCALIVFSRLERILSSYAKEYLKHFPCLSRTLSRFSNNSCVLC